MSAVKKMWLGFRAICEIVFVAAWILYGISFAGSLVIVILPSIIQKDFILIKDLYINFGIHSHIGLAAFSTGLCLMAGDKIA